MSKDISTKLNFQKSKVPFIGSEVRYAKDGDDIWFVAKDIADILGYERQGKMYDRIDDDDKKDTTLQFGASYQSSVIINESGFYTAVLGSTKPEAKEFKRWVTKELLPSIRRTGAYISNNATDEQVAFLYENQIVEKLKLSLKSRQIVLPVLFKLMDVNDIRYVNNTSLPYIIKQLASTGEDLKIKLFDKLDEVVRKWGNAKYKNKQLTFGQMFDNQQLLTTIATEKAKYLSTSRSQKVRRLNEKVDKLKKKGTN